MRKITILATTALIALAGPALAGGGADKAGTKLKYGTEMKAGGSAKGRVQTPATGSAEQRGIGAGGGADMSAQGSAGVRAGQPNLGTVVSTIQASKTGADEIRTLSGIDTVEVVEVSQLTGSENAQADARAVENAVSQNEMDIDELRAAIESNSELSAELESQGVTLDNVIAAKVEADGKVTIFTRRG